MKQKQNEAAEREEEFKSNYVPPPPEYNRNIKASIADSASLMPSMISTVAPPPPAQSWTSKFLPNKVNERRQKNYEKRVLKKIQEDQISHAPECEGLPSVKEKSINDVNKAEKVSNKEQVVAVETKKSESIETEKSDKDEKLDVDEVLDDSSIETISEVPETKAKDSVNVCH